MSADLHCHSYFSDSSCSVQDLVTMAKLQGLSALSITDHDTLDSLSLAKTAGRQCGVEIIPGVELSGYDYQRNDKAHLLCYLPKKPQALAEHFATVHQNRETATRAMLSLVMEQYPITESMVNARACHSTSLYKQHILHTLIDAGYAKEFFGSEYQHLFSHKNGIAHLEIPYPDIYTVIEAAKAARGVLVLAHPGESKKQGLAEELVKQGLIDGIELYCPKNKGLIQQSLQALGERYDLLLTGGTDFHGMYSSRKEPIGSYRTSEEMLQRLKELSAQK